MKKLHFDRHKLIVFIILAILFVFLVNPKWMTFLSDADLAAYQSTLQHAFGQTDSEPWRVPFARLVTLAAVAALLYACFLALHFVLSRVRWKTTRGRTIAGLVLSVIQYGTLIAGVLWGLSIFGVNTTAVLASVGVLGIVLGLGAQSLIADILAGVFLIVEGQFGVGDVVILGDFRGRVLSLGVRTTVIQDASGNRKIINNSDLRSFQSRAESLSFVTADIGVAYEQPLAPVEALIRKAMPALQAEYPAIFPEPPRYLGVQSLDSSAVVLRVLAYVDEMNAFEARRALNRGLKLLFDENGVRVPYAQLVVHTAPDAEKAET